MVDYNLVGMAHVHFSRALFRSPVPARRASLTRPKFGRAAEAHASPEAQGGPVEADLGASGRKAGRRRHRYSLDGASIKIEYEQDESQVDRSGPVGSPASSLEVHERERPVYVQGTVAADWIWGAAGGVSQAGGQSRVPVKQSCCELEADAAVEGGDQEDPWGLQVWSLLSRWCVLPICETSA